LNNPHQRDSPPQPASLAGDDVTGWPLFARAMHWLVALLVAIEVPLGFWMLELSDAQTKIPGGDDTWIMPAINAHHTIGFLILILAILRVNWRLNNPTPDLPAYMNAYQRLLSRSTQAFLYFLMFFYPLTGWAAVSTSTEATPVLFFGWEIPRMVAQPSEAGNFTYDLFTSLHQACWKIGGALLTLHIAGALWHQFIKKEDVLTRMWLGTMGSDQHK